jgi:hypothetical protein
MDNSIKLMISFIYKYKVISINKVMYNVFSFLSHIATALLKTCTIEVPLLYILGSSVL